MYGQARDRQHRIPLAALTDNILVNTRSSIAMRAQQHGLAVVGARWHRGAAAGRVSSRVSSQQMWCMSRYSAGSR